MAYIERAITEVLRNRVKSSKCFLLTGARQVGKSTVLQHALREIHEVRFNRHFIPTDTYIQEREQELKPYGDIWQTIHKRIYARIYWHCQWSMYDAS